MFRFLWESDKSIDLFGFFCYVYCEVSDDEALKVKKNICKLYMYIIYILYLMLQENMSFSLHVQEDIEHTNKREER